MKFNFTLFLLLVVGIGFSQNHKKIEKNVKKYLDGLGGVIELTEEKKEMLFVVLMEKQKKIKGIRAAHKNDKAAFDKAVKALHPEYNAKVRDVIGKANMNDYFAYTKSLSNSKKKRHPKTSSTATHKDKKSNDENTEITADSYLQFFE